MKKKLTLFLLAMMCTIGTWADNVCKNTATGTGYATIQAAVDAVAEGQTIQVISDVSITSTITITSSIPAFTLDVNGHVLDGSALPEQACIISVSTDGNLTLIDSNPTATHTQTGLTEITGGVLTGGKKGAINLDGGDMYIEGCTITGNKGCEIIFAAGINIKNPKNEITIKNCVIANNSTDSHFGSINATGKGIILDGCTVKSNSAGGLYGGPSADNITLKNCVITDNNAMNMTGVFVRQSIKLCGKNIIKNNETTYNGPRNLIIMKGLVQLVRGSDFDNTSEIGVTFGEMDIYTGGLITSASLMMSNAASGDASAFTSDDPNYEIAFAKDHLDVVIPLNESTITKEKLTSWKNQGEMVKIGRTFYKDGYYNSLCLPFSLNATALAASPLAGYKALKKFVSAEVEGSTLNITLEDATEIEAGVPYFISWAVASENIVNPVFEYLNVTHDEAGKIEHDNADCDGTFIPTTLEKDNQNYLFLGANNTLYWPNTTNPLKGFRCYFEVKPASGAKYGMNAQFADDATTGISQMENGKLRIENVKFIENGRVVLVKDGVRYNTSGQMLR